MLMIGWSSRSESTRCSFACFHFPFRLRVSNLSSENVENANDYCFLLLVSSIELMRCSTSTQVLVIVYKAMISF